jgi:hypothetical protein
MDVASRLAEIKAMPMEERMNPLTALAESVVESGEKNRDLAQAIVELVESETGLPAARLRIADALGYLDDPRLSSPDQDAYWARIPSDRGVVVIGRFPVTNQEYRKFVEAGGYDRRELWTDAGWAWCQSTDNTWPQLASGEDARPFVVPNQPVVGVCFHEAVAYARFHGARLPRWDERVWVVRGAERRPYPWGDPFGEGNANTKEEVLGRACAVGLFRRDVTPDGVYDLAGNAGEWTGDVVGEECLIHPGAWDQPSMAAWAKALTSEKPHVRWSALGFRLARDPE